VADYLDGVGVGQVEDDAGGVAGFAPPVADPVDGPGALHFEVGVEDPVAELHEQVFAVGPDAFGDVPVEGGQCHGGHAQGGVEDLPAGHELQPPGELEDGVTFGHSFTLPPRGFDPVSCPCHWRVSCPVAVFPPGRIIARGTGMTWL